MRYHHDANEGSNNNKSSSISNNNSNSNSNNNSNNNNYEEILSPNCSTPELSARKNKRGGQDEAHELYSEVWMSNNNVV
ncbi:hypothetical protein PoB_001991700 [Plakobranchus ocellatus]|uniref:Uncharacterized protein n=1 Tax=Plakobranchus ocellatus TaxID=259542 RepID=A0AAV3ZFV5_9GAST|nr:hypothetical protein PoB_001991700 [Plakobranchus ocellatus]